MAGLWCLKYRHPIGNRLHPGHRSTARGKGLQYQQQAQTFRSPNRIHRRRRRRLPLQQPQATHQDQQQHRKHEGIGRQAEGSARFPQTPQVHPTHNQEQYEAEGHRVGQQLRHQRSDRLGAGHQTHRCGEYVVDHQGSRRHQAGLLAKV